MRSDRPYREAWPESKVREHLRSLAGTHFDPHVVKAFLELEPMQTKHPAEVPLEDLLQLIEQRKATALPPEVPWAQTTLTSNGH
jgi:HD-GYP domain-containing protein (c-di-GMP phosphodiesterase class II)